MKKQNGITLIALIITIIVMIILVAVVVSIALNGGIFDQARSAAKQTQKTAYEETLELAVTGAYNPVTGKVNETKLKTDLEAQGWKVEEQDGQYICTSPEESKITFSAKVSEDGTIGDSTIGGEITGNGTIGNEALNSIPNGTYYAFGESAAGVYLRVSDSGNVFGLEGLEFETDITITNGKVTITLVGSEEEYRETIVFDGNYQETKNNKIITIGMGEFGTTGNNKNSRLGYILAVNSSDLKHDIEGTYLGNKTNRITFTKGSNMAIRTFQGISEPERFIYAGFEDMFYMAGRQIKYIGLEEGFGYGENGTHNREN